MNQNGYIYTIVIRGGTILFILMFAGNVFSQTFRTINFINDSAERELSLRTEASTFFKNNEYFTCQAYGYTGVGFFFKPALEYYLTPSTRASAGLFFHTYFEAQANTTILPIFSIQQKITNSLEVVFGSIYGTLNHNLEEPIFRFDHYYQNNVEYGIQLFWHTNRIFIDTWMNWENFIHNGDPEQEVFVVGSSGMGTVWEKSIFTLKIPLQLMITHRGGQLNGIGILTMLNGATGVLLDHRINPHNTLGIEPLFFFYKGLTLPDTGPNRQRYENGYGLYCKLNYNNRYVDALMGYWYADQFIAPRGEYLFQSVSEIRDNPTVKTKNDNRWEIKQLLTGKIIIKRKISNAFRIEARAEGYYDILENEFDYSYSLFFVLNESFFIKKFKKTVPASYH